MWKKIIFIIITIILLFGLIFLGYFIWKNIQAKKQSGETVTLRDYFPFGKGILTNIGQNKPDTTDGNTEEGETPIEQVNKPRLRKITDNPVAGFTTLTKEVPVNPDEIPEPVIKTVTPKGTLTKTLKFGSRDPEVKILQQTLNLCTETQLGKTSYGSPGQETEIFSKATLNALIRLQTRFKNEILVPQGLDKASGILDEKTRELINKPFACEPETTKVGATIKKSVVRYVERQNGNIYDAFEDTLDARRISNTTIPKIEEALFVDNGMSVLLRYLRDDNRTIETFLGKLPEQQALGGDSLPELTGNFLQQNIFDIVASPDTKQVFYLTPFSDGILGYVSDIITGKRTQVYTSPLRGWLPSWVKDGIYVTTKATGYTTSTLFKLDPLIETKSQEKIIGNVYGMATLLSPNGESVLYSRGNKDGVGLIIYNKKDKKYTDTKINTLVEKCVWTNDSLYIYCGVPDNWSTGIYPDIWYQGESHFTDSLWRIDATGIFGNTKLENVSQTGEENIDIIKPQISVTNQYLYFINKNNLSFWQYNISGI